MATVKDGATALTAAAEWISGLRYADLPQDVLRLARGQRIDIVACMLAGSRTAAGRAVLHALDGLHDQGEVCAFPDARQHSVLGAVYQHATLGSALELDDFVFGGHTGQCAVGVPLAVGQATRAGGEELVVAQVVANEVAGRLGALMTTGPQHGHMKAYMHRLGAAAATARLLGLNRKRTANALAIALGMPEYPLFPASFSADTKLLCAGDPAVAGVRAGFLAEAGLDAALDIVEHAVGLVRALSDATGEPAPWDRLGDDYALRAISFKPIAACAYAVAAGLAASEIRDALGTAWFPSDLSRIQVETSVLSVAMEGFSRSHRQRAATPVNTNFSTRRTVALALLAGAPCGEHFVPERFAGLAGSIESVAERVELRHAWPLTLSFLRGVDAAIDHAGRPGIYGMTESHRTMAKFRSAMGTPAAVSWTDVGALLALAPADRAYLARRYAAGLRAKLPFWGGHAARARYVSRERNLADFAFRVSGRVTVRDPRGGALTREVLQPPGFAGDPSREAVPRAKFEREAKGVLGDALPLLAALESEAPLDARGLTRALAASVMPPVHAEPARHSGT
jgi:2-methylcitrate dehydratase PrpD